MNVKLCGACGHNCNSPLPPSLHVFQVPGLIEDLQLVLLKQIITDEHTDLGILAHPLLSLILASVSLWQGMSGAGFVGMRHSYTYNSWCGMDVASYVRAFVDLTLSLNRLLHLTLSLTRLLSLACCPASFSFSLSLSPG